MKFLCTENLWAWNSSCKCNRSKETVIILLTRNTEAIICIERIIMASHNDLGRYGEQLAISYLSAAGFDVLFKNWRHSYYEIDVICSRHDVLHFIEIKTR